MTGFVDQGHIKPKVLAPPSNETFDYFINFHQYKS